MFSSKVWEEKNMQKTSGLTEANSLASADSELAQCEAEVATMLHIIAELNVKMGALDLKDNEAQGQACTSISEVKSRPLATQSSTVVDAGTASVGSEKMQGWRESEVHLPCPTTGGSEELWPKLQQVLSTLEYSARKGRMLVGQHLHNDGKTQTEHITAARETWVQATQVLEEMEREFGISYPSALPSEDRQRYQRDILSFDKLNQDLRTRLQNRQEEQMSAERAILDLEEEKKRLREKLIDLRRTWLTGASGSPPRSPPLPCSRTSSPCWASPPFPASPLLSRRLPCRPPASLSQLVGSPPGSSVLEAETERLQRCLERLKVRNECLALALERRKGELEQVSMALSRHEADCSALHMALAYCEECEEAYGDLLSLFEARKEQNAVLAEPSTPQQADFLIAIHGVSYCTPEDAMMAKPNSLSPEDFEDKTGVLQQRIARLKQDRAAVCIPEQTRTGEGKLSPDTGTLAEARRHGSPPLSNSKGEKAALLHELVTVREEMSELRGLIRLKEKERRCLEHSLTVHQCQDLAGAVITKSLQEELEDRRAEQQRMDENRAKLESGGGIPGPRNHAIIRELRAALQREETLKRRVTSLRDSLDATLLDYTTQRTISKEEVARLSLCHNKAMSAYRSARKKQQEQLWKFERQITAMAERHVAQAAELKTTLEALEWKKEETIL
ncbi:colorectal mutant cancer protein isoform X2 [Electrophorus electricus]|uniref:colorectal mutant cancer protein isoform X2 n=1 Tax=Electrophorus electricus TaxID=8005 RepID=UPI0015D0629A|nr:colorectal mutant cancer protein isoform X2 [Electrophorus electricus]